MDIQHKAVEMNPLLLFSFNIRVKHVHHHSFSCTCKKIYILEAGIYMYIFTSQCYFCQFLTHISVDIESFWGFRFCEKLKDKHTEQIFIYK